LFLFFFSFLWIGYYVCCQCTHQGGHWGPEPPRTGRWSLLGVMSDWQCDVDRLLAKYCRRRLQLDLRWCRWRAGAKSLSLAAPSRSGETSRLGSMDPVAERDQVRVARCQEKKDEVVDLSWCKVAAHNRSLHARFAMIHHRIIWLIGWATKPRPEAQQAETGSGRAEKLWCRGTHGGVAGLVSGGRGLRQRHGRPMKRCATSPYCPWGVCISF
jgi:hypothetical protein